MPFDSINTSDHTLIKVEITTQISKLAPKSAKFYTKTAWHKCNSDEYKKIIQTEIGKHKNTIKLSVADRIAKLENTLHKAERKSIPKYRRLKTLKSVGRGIWNRNIDQASKESKKPHWIWKNKHLKRKKGYDKEKPNIASSTATSICLKEGQTDLRNYGSISRR